MKYVYIIFEYYDDVSCEKLHESPYESDKHGKPKKYLCGQKILTSKIIRFVTTDEELAIRFTKNKPTWSYQKEVLWTNLT